jgi:hypothetical protein
MRRGRSTRSEDRPRVLPSRVCSAFRISHPLDGFLPPLPFRPCFVPVTLMGLLPFRAFPSRRSRYASRRPLPSCRFRYSRRRRSQPGMAYLARRPSPVTVRSVPMPSSTSMRARSTSGFRTSLESVVLRSGVSPPAGPVLSWASSSPGSLTRSISAPASRRLLP